MKRALALLAAALVAAEALAQPVPEERTRNQRFKSEWEVEQDKRNLVEGEVSLPDYPVDANLIQFLVSSASSFRFYIDASTLAPGADGVIRYVLVARSPSGYANVSYEGMRCVTSSYQVYALGDGGKWNRRESEWREIELNPVRRWHAELRSRYFCAGSVPITTVAEGRDALRRGGHPAASVKTGSER